jgi:hypothetical protein
MPKAGAAVRVETQVEERVRDPKVVVNGSKGGGKNGKGCKFIHENKPCPYGGKCYSFWSHKPPLIDIAANVKDSSVSSCASASSGGENFHLKGVKPVSNVA